MLLNNAKTGLDIFPRRFRNLSEILQYLTRICRNEAQTRLPQPVKPTECPPARADRRVLTCVTYEQCRAGVGSPGASRTGNPN